MKKAYEIIKELRIKNGFSQKELADKLGTSQQAIALLENGKRKLYVDLFIEILNIFKEPLANHLYELDLDDEVNLIVTDMEITNIGRTMIYLLNSIGYFVEYDENTHNWILTNNQNNIRLSLTNDEIINFQQDIFSYADYRLKRLVEFKTEKKQNDVN